MIERITTSVDLYPNLRVEVSVQGRGRERPREPRPVNPQERAALPEPAEDFGGEATLARVPKRAEREERVVRFEQSAVADDSDQGRRDSAQEAMPALAASVVPYDPRMSVVAALYSHNGRAAAQRAGTVGTRLDAVA